MEDFFYTQPNNCKHLTIWLESRKKSNTIKKIRMLELSRGQLGSLWFGAGFMLIDFFKKKAELNV